MFLSVWTGSGRVAADAVVRQAGEREVLSFRIGTSSPYGDRDKNPTVWRNVSLWGPSGGKQIANLVGRITKGIEIVVSGEESMRAYEYKGEQRESLEIRANTVQLVSNGRTETFTGDAAPEADEPLPF